jgi:hypothetical protein
MAVYQTNGARRALGSLTFHTSIVAQGNARATFETHRCRGTFGRAIASRHARGKGISRRNQGSW